jgi:hypothetical protein
MSEGAVDHHLQEFWHGELGRSAPAPSVRDIWMEQCRVARQDGLPEPLFEDTLKHFVWFFEVPV